MIFYVVEIAGKKYIEAKGVIDETNYTHAVNQLEEVMWAVYPEVFHRHNKTTRCVSMPFVQDPSYKQPKGAMTACSGFVNIERDDGETDTLTVEEARRLDLKFRERQVPINSKLNG